MAQESMKEILTVRPITEAEIRQMNREYNPSEWDKTIDRYAKYAPVQFYLAEKQKGYDYDRYYATYTTPEGITFFKSISYVSSLSNNGFVRITIDPKGIVRRFLLKDIHGNEGRGGNDKGNRKIMAGNSAKFGAIFSNEF